MKRRDFIRISGLTIPLSFHGLSLSALSSRSWGSLIDNESDRVLVLIQLNGGNDGLNTIVPMDQYSLLQAVRPDLILPENEVLAIDQDLALHPELAELRELYIQDQVSIVQGVAYPDQNRSHFRSTDIWTSASGSSEVIRTGWLGRYFQDQHSTFPEGYPNEDCPDPFALTMGYLASETCQGLSSNFSMAINTIDELNPLTEGEAGEVPDSRYGMELDFLRTAIAQTNQYTASISDAAEAGTNDAEYDGNNLAQGLRSVARLISGGLQTKVYVVSIGGFDTHANQIEDGDALGGLHARLLRQLSGAIFSFQQDLENQGLAHRVLGMTFSEFGRQIAQNFSLGTDHGTAAPMILFGNCVEPGILGANDIIPEEVEPQEGVAMQYDFRDVYGSLLVDWFGASPDKVRELIYEDFVKLPILSEACLPTSTEDMTTRETLQIRVLPNPVRRWAKFEFELPQSALVNLRIFDSVGKQHKQVLEGRLDAGSHTVSCDCHDLVSGNYYYRLQAEGLVKTGLMVVVN